MTEQNLEQKEINKLRVFFSIFYFLIAIALILFFRDKIFYFQSLENSWNIYRLIWCYSGSALGFAFIALTWRHVKKSPLPEYLTHYPFQLLAISTIVFGGLHLFEITSGYLFYYFSFGLCFTLGYLADSYWSFFSAVIKRSNNYEKSI